MWQSSFSDWMNIGLRIGSWNFKDPLLWCKVETNRHTAVVDFVILKVYCEPVTDNQYLNFPIQSTDVLLLWLFWTKASHGLDLSLQMLLVRHFEPCGASTNNYTRDLATKLQDTAKIKPIFKMGKCLFSSLCFFPSSFVVTPRRGKCWEQSSLRAAASCGPVVCLLFTNDTGEWITYGQEKICQGKSGNDALLFWLWTLTFLHSFSISSVSDMKLILVILTQQA